MRPLLSLAVLAATCALLVSGEPEYKGTKVGTFTNKAHGVAGTVYVKNEQTIFIEDFEYDGAGPDAFFWAGIHGRPSDEGTILPYPFNGKFYEYNDNKAPILEKAFNKVDITLTLPPQLKASDLKWLSVWCRQYSVNFGDIFFPEDLHIDHDHHADAEAEAEAEGEAEGEAESEAESEAEAEAEDGYKHDHDHDHDLPPPLLEPTSNAHDPSHREGHKGDADAESEAESESEPYSGGARDVASHLGVVAAAAVLSAIML